jgi:hypothetical protein
VMNGRTPGSRFRASRDRRANVYPSGPLRWHWSDPGGDYID